jgi:ankyrin repeat protein
LVSCFSLSFLNTTSTVFARTAEAETPLWIAAGANNVEALKVLLPLSIDVINDTDDAGQTPLLIASMEECTESVEVGITL